MSYPHPCFNPLIPNQIECNNKQLLLLVMLIDLVITCLGGQFVMNHASAFLKILKLSE